MTSVTWNGSALTQQIAREYSGFGSFIYTLANPATGTHNVVVTPAGTSSMAVQITGVKKTHNTTPVSGATYAEGTSTAPSVNVTSASGALVFDCLCSNNDTPLPTLTVGAGQTQQAKRTSGSYNSGAFSKEDGAGTTAMSWTISASREWVTTAISVNPE
jgi:hypothetical protein